MTERNEEDQMAVLKGNDVNAYEGLDPAKSKWTFADLHSSYTAWIILFLSALISAVAWYISYNSVMHAAEQRFKFKIEDVQAAVQRRMEEHEATLWSGIGIFRASDELNREEWHDFVNALNLETFLPGLQGMGYSKMLKPSEVEAHINKVRSEGFEDFTLRPKGVRDTYSSIVYLEPFSGRNLRAFGYDMFSEPTRREAMSRARDTGRAAISGVVTLVQETSSDVQKGFLMYLPHYKKGVPLGTVEERREALLGFVYSPFRMNDLMRGILGRGDNDITFRVYDGADKQADRRMYESDYANTSGVDDVGSTVFSATHTLNIAGREWALDFESGPNFISAGEENQPFIVAAGAIIIDLLLFLTISSLTNQRRNALKMARRMTKEIRFAKDLAERSTEREIVLRQATEESNRKLEEANEGLLKFSSIVAHDLRAPLKRIETFAGILREDYKDRLDEDGLDILARMDRGSVRMRMMLDALHSYSKFSGVSLKGKYASINAVVEATVENLQEQLQGVKLTKDIDSGLIVAGDPHLLGNVFQNLISNSIKFSDKAVPEINIEVKLDGEDRIIASVSDNGIGIEPQYADKVFTMFERLHDEDEFEGTGIGLAIARKIIRDHKGEIEVDTTYVGGTRIHFHLPLYQGDEKSISLDELQEVVGRDDEESAVAA